MFWAVGWKNQGQELDDFKYMERWFEELSERPALQRGMQAGSDFGEDYSKLSQAERESRIKLLYNQRARPAPD